MRPSPGFRLICYKPRLPLIQTEHRWWLGCGEGGQKATYARCRTSLKSLHCFACEKKICLQLNMPHRAALGLDAAFPEYMYYSDNSSDTRLACTVPVTVQSRSHWVGRWHLSSGTFLITTTGKHQHPGGKSLTRNGWCQICRALFRVRDLPPGCWCFPVVVRL